MVFKIDLASPTSAYLQICEQVKYAVASGVLLTGDRLPPIREVAATTRVNRNTIARAYAELERDGVIVSHRGRGSFVAPGGSAIQKRQRLRVLEEMIRKLLVEAYHFQISPAELSQLFTRVEATLSAEKDKEKPS